MPTMKSLHARWQESHRDWDNGIWREKKRKVKTRFGTNGWGEDRLKQTPGTMKFLAGEDAQGGEETLRKKTNENPRRNRTGTFISKRFPENTAKKIKG